MACKRSEQCEHADICKYAKSNAYDILGGSCYRPKKPQTNEEYIRICSTEELAEFITKVILSDRRFCATRLGGVEETKAWLKEKHNEMSDV